MDAKKIYKQKIEARLVLAHAQSKLNDLKALAKSCPGDKIVELNNEIDEFEKNLLNAKCKLREMNEAGDDAWEHFKESAGHVWNVLRASVRDAAAKCKELN